MCWVPNVVHAALEDIDRSATAGARAGRGDVHDGARVPKRVVERGHRCAVRRVGNLSDEHGRRVLRERDAKTDQEARADEHVHACRARLEDDGGDHDSSAEEDGHAAPETIGNVRRKRICGERADVLNGVEETKLRARWRVEVRVPLLKRLEAKRQSQWRRNIFFKRTWSAFIIEPS
jgi:hypothetical protein